MKSKFLQPLVYTLALFAGLHMTILVVVWLRTGEASLFSLGSLLDIGKVVSVPPVANNVPISVGVYVLVFFAFYFLVKPPKTK